MNKLLEAAIMTLESLLIWLVVFVVGGLASFLIGLIAALVIGPLWNAGVVPYCGLEPITYWQTVMVFTLVRVVILAFPKQEKQQNTKLNLD